MANSSPLRPVDDYLLDARNSPEAQRRKHAEAQREHEIVLQRALHALSLHELAEAQREIEEQERRRVQRVAEEAKRIEAERQAKIRQLEDEAHLAAQKAKPIPKPVVQPPPPAPAPVPAPAPASTPKQEAPKPAAPSTTPQPAASTAVSKPTNGANPFGANPFGTPSQPAASQPAASPFAKLAPTATSTPAPAPTPAPAVKAPTPASAAASAATPTPAPAQPPKPDRHIEIHKKLKELRNFMALQSKQNPALKARMGDMRRDIRKSFGQLTSGGLKENKVPVARIAATLQAGLNNEVPSEPIDPNQFVLEPRTQAVEGCQHNEGLLPSLYLYLLNIFAKAAISQFINESGADPRTAEYIGQVVVKVYSEAQFLWRGQTMIDMLVAKYRVVCPVLFGFRGNDRMERGRAQVGWRKEDGRWIAEQYHIDRMTGLGAGFAAITLRDFSRVKRTTPWPPTVYWTALAQIVNTPAAEMSETQCYVLKAMIADNETKFLGFYGNAGIAALRCALVDYPSRIPKSTAASETLKVLAKTINVRTGLDLEQM
ncbi:gle1-like protein [Ophiostoma piceae UAMH 11346]|uniref:mRNA export factor GLE1 n=1 Tax=Ophiostoma piceae (strain UAMH 11346) TaxID=1262450 RepID=S3CX12_OPHP1|nr:gle1-like protein [Ophiostoma piceae UAMH 11346]